MWLCPRCEERFDEDEFDREHIAGDGWHAPREYRCSCPNCGLDRDDCEEVQTED